MEKEDPLERIERKERERKEGGNLKTIMYALIAVVVALAIALVVVWSQRSHLSKNMRTLANDLEAEKEALADDIVALRDSLASTTFDNAIMKAQLDSSREAVSQLVQRIQGADATNRSEIIKYQKELGTLRAIMKGYIVQIDSLNNLNHELTIAAANAKKEAAESQRQNAKLTAQVDNLSTQVAAGSVLKARGIKMEAYNASDKVTDRSSRVTRLMVSLSLVENELAPRGPVRVYVVVRDPSGNLLDDGTGAGFSVGGEPVKATASREVDYEGSEVDLSIYVNGIASFTKGIYSVEAFTEQGRLGGAELMLR